MPGLESNATAAMQARLILAMARRQLGKTNDAPVTNDKQFSLSGGDWNDQMTTELLAREARKVLSQ